MLLTKQQKQYGLHLLLFIVTCITTTIAGAEWMTGKLFFLGQEAFTWTGSITWTEFLAGLYFSVPFIGVLTVHEFGHYFTARHYKTQVTLPYYIPLWFGITAAIGTMGAFIRIKSRIYSRQQFFDIGIAGPLAGFIVAIPLLWYGFTHLPAPEHIFTIHPEYQKYGLDYAAHVYEQGVGNFSLGKNLLFLFFEKYVANAPVPNAYEIIHYPILFAGYLALFFTALNLLPIGQLDGGHVLYGLLGYKRFNRLSPIFFSFFILYAGLGVISPHNEPLWSDELMYVFVPFTYWAFRKMIEDRRYSLGAAMFMLMFQYSLSATLPDFAGYIWVWPTYVLYLLFVLQPAMPKLRFALLTAAAIVVLQVLITFLFPDADGYSGWIVYSIVLSRFMGLFHPSCPNERPLTPFRKVLAVLAFVIFILCFSPTPFVIE